MSEGGKTMMALLVLGLAGVGAYSSGQSVLSAIRSFENEPTPVTKKISPVKPKNFGTGKSAAIVIAATEPAQQEYTFFETLTDSSMMKFTGLEGTVLSKASALPNEDAPPLRKVQKKAIRLVETAPSYPPHPAPVNVEKAAFVEKATAAVAPDTFSSQGAKADRKTDWLNDEPVYAVQVSSFKDLERAENLKNKLVGKGYDAFRVVSELADGSRQVRHRVYLGKYQNRSEASFAASNAHRRESLSTMIVSMSPGFR